MRTSFRVAATLSFAAAAVVLPAPGASALPLGWPPCAYPEQDDRNSAAFQLERSAKGGKVTGGSVLAGASFLTTCPGATYDFTFSSAVRDRDGALLPLGWSLASAPGGQEPAGQTETTRTVRFVGDGLGQSFTVQGATSAGYYERKVEDTAHCVLFSVVVTLEGQRYELPSSGSAFIGCSGSGGATSSFR